MKSFVLACVVLVLALAAGHGQEYAAVPLNDDIVGKVQYTDSPSQDEMADRRTIGKQYLKLSEEYARLRVSTATTSESTQALAAETSLLQLRLQLTETLGDLSLLEAQLDGWSNLELGIEGSAESLKAVRETRTQLTSLSDRLPNAKQLMERFKTIEAKQQHAKDAAETVKP